VSRFSGAHFSVDRGNSIDIAHLLGNLNASNDRGLSMDDSWICFHSALVDFKSDASSAESADIHFGGRRHQLEEPFSSFEDRRRASDTAAREHGGEDRLSRRELLRRAYNIIGMREGGEDSYWPVRVC
jgi:hypothetical protein